MPELASILEAYSVRRIAGERMLLATVIGTKGSTYRKAGARMLVTADSHRFGSISGGCLEADVAKKGWWWTERGPVTRTYDTTMSEHGEPGDIPFGLGCNGTVRILVERLDDAASARMIEFLANCRTARKTCVVATIVSAPDGMGVQCGDRLLVHDRALHGSLRNPVLHEVLAQDAQAALSDRSTRLLSYSTSSGPLDVFIEVIAPPAPLVVFGAGQDAVPLVRLAKELGWYVAVADGRPSYAQPHLFPWADQVILTQVSDPLAGVTVGPDTIAVVMNHSYAVDRDIVGRLLAAKVAYVGVLGPAIRTGRMLQDLEITCRPACLHAPVGLDIGASTPETIALSIVAEIQAALTSRTGGMLRHRRASIEPHLTESKEILHEI